MMRDLSEATAGGLAMPARDTGGGAWWLVTPAIPDLVWLPKLPGQFFLLVHGHAYKNQPWVHA